MHAVAAEDSGDRVPAARKRGGRDRCATAPVQRAPARAMTSRRGTRPIRRTRARGPPAGFPHAATVATNVSGWPAGLDGCDEEIAVDEGTVTSSNAPMSQPVLGAAGRGTPRSSTDPAVAQPADAPASTAGLPGESASVCGGPPAVGSRLALSASAPSSGLAPSTSPAAADSPQLPGEASSRLCPSLVSFPAQFAPPPKGAEKIVFSAFPAPLTTARLAPTSAPFAARVSLTSARSRGFARDRATAARGVVREGAVDDRRRGSFFERDRPAGFPSARRVGAERARGHREVHFFFEQQRAASLFVERVADEHAVGDREAAFRSEVVDRRAAVAGFGVARRVVRRSGCGGSRRRLPPPRAPLRSRRWSRCH